MKFTAFFVLMMMVAVQAFALPAAPAPGLEEPEPQPAGNLPSGAAKAKRALYYYPPLVPRLNYYHHTPTFYYNSYNSFNPYDVIF